MSTVSQTQEIVQQALSKPVDRETAEMLLTFLNEISRAKKMELKAIEKIREFIKARDSQN